MNSSMRLAAGVLLLGSPALAQWTEPAVRTLGEYTASAPGASLGFKVASLGDVDGDGSSDFVAAAPYHSVGSRIECGKLYAFSGASGALLWTFEEFAGGMRLGWSLELVDWNGDGTLDVVAGAPFNFHGRVWVLSGRSGAVLTRMDAPPGVLWFGYSLATGGDLNGRELDLIVSAPDSETALGRHTGELYFYPVGWNLPIQWQILEGPVRAGEFGVGLAMIGDLSSPPDGYAEFVVGNRAGRSQATGVYWEGQARVYSYDRQLGRFIELHVVEGIGLGHPTMPNPFAASGDLDRDGFPDFLASDTYAREVEAISGRTGNRLYTLSDLGGFTDFDPSAIALGDLDGDGGPDLAIGSQRDSSSALEAGRVYLCSGASGNLLATITAGVPALHLGASLFAPGDLDGDGRPDLLVGATGTNLVAPPEGRLFALSAHLPAPPNEELPAQAPGDPRLSDAGGDPGSGPLVRSALEPFALGLDCRSGASGSWIVHGHLGRRANPYPSAYGSIWVAGPRIFSFAGAYPGSPLTIGPVVLPASSALIGLQFVAQGACLGSPTRTSSALVQTIR